MGDMQSHRVYAFLVVDSATDTAYVELDQSDGVVFCEDGSYLPATIRPIAAEPVYDESQIAFVRDNPAFSTVTAADDAEGTITVSSMCVDAQFDADGDVTRVDMLSALPGVSIDDEALSRQQMVTHLADIADHVAGGYAGDDRHAAFSEHLRPEVLSELAYEHGVSGNEAAQRMLGQFKRSLADRGYIDDAGDASVDQPVVDEGTGEVYDEAPWLEESDAYGSSHRDDVDDYGDARVVHEDVVHEDAASALHPDSVAAKVAKLQSRLGEKSDWEPAYQ